MSKHIALYGKTFCYSGGGHFIITLLARALTIKNKNLSSKNNITLLLPDHLKNTPTRMIRRPLGIAKRFFLEKIGLAKQKNYLDGRKIIKLLKKINLDIKVAFYEDNEKSLEACMNKINADVLLMVMENISKSFSKPWISGIYDLQYKFYPEFFPCTTVEKGITFHERDKEFDETLENTNVILTISKNTKNDIKKFFPRHKNKIFPMPLQTYPEKKWFTVPFKKLEKKYHIPKKYFLISNQFWVHKSHRTAFLALKLFHEKTASCSNVHIICTGVAHDQRFPHYFDELKNEIKTLGLENHIHFLGHIPKVDQIGLLRHSIALVQPTMFEGSPGSGAFYDAIAVRKTAILSDIPVNLEIKDFVTDDMVKTFFFKTKSASDLAEKMLIAYTNHESLQQDTPSITFQESRKNAEKNFMKIGDVILDAVETAIKMKVSP